VRALGEAYPERVDVTDAVYAGYSQGAQMGLLTLADAASVAPRLFLVEGGAGDLNRARVERLARSGARALALVCGTPGCRQRAERARTVLSAAGLRHATYHAEGAGHTMLGGVEIELERAFAELTRDDGRWAR
jgi:predicted esterase